jgi:bifunctional UDP-N-acetylglucosamine pyrophosphorylase / glucosamine-1-phosphate N-acetyltransferase
MRICAVIPAAGRGTRLGLETPKILVSIDKNRTIWSVLENILVAYVDHIHVILSPDGQEQFAHRLQQNADTVKKSGQVSTSIQMHPLGMGDAIFGAHHIWCGYEVILIAWGDQVNLSRKTIAEVTTQCCESRTIVLPLTRMDKPYVQYDFEGDRLVQIRQTREGDATDAQGDSDIGLFALSARGLNDHWLEYLGKAPPGKATNEINFLPFLTYLSSECNWDVHRIMIPDSDEARGVNTPEDLAFARAKLAGS